MAISGTGTASDPYIPTTFADFKTCVGRNGAYVCLTQDIDVSKDSVYKTGITSSLNITCRYVYGTAMTYSSTTSYAVGNKCTYNDGEHGLCTYECIQACTGIDVTNTEYWTRGGNPTKKITGLIITANYCFSCNQYNNEITIANLFFESCVWDKTYDTSSMFHANESYSSRTIRLNDCSFSMFYNQHSYEAHITDQCTFIFNRCSLYINFSHSVSGNFYAYGTVGSNTSFNNCTIDMSDFCAPTTSSYYLMRGLTNSSVHIVCDVGYSNNGNQIQFVGTNSFFAITVRNVYGTYYSSVALDGVFSGTNIIDKDVLGNITLNSSIQNLIAGTTEQCKDKDWLTSKGFFTS
jgi:hypothetical protein